MWVGHACMIDRVGGVPMYACRGACIWMMHGPLRAEL